MKKERKRLNVIDVVIIFLLVAIVGTAGYKIYTEVTDGRSSRQSNIFVVFEAEVEDEGILNYLGSGSEVYLASDKSLVGNLYDGNADDGVGAVYKAGVADNGRIILRGALRLTGNAYKAENGEYYVVNNRNISVGTMLDVYTDKAVVKITVKSIELLSK